MEQLDDDHSMPKFFKVMLKLFLYSVAIFPKKYEFLSKIYYFLYVTIVGASVLGSIFPLLLFTNSKHKLEVISTIVPQITDLWIFMYFHHRRNGILKVIGHLSRHNFNASEILITTEKFFKIKFLTCFAIHSLWASCFVTATTLYVFSGNPISDKYSLMVPFWYSCGEGNADTIFSNFCWNVDTHNELWLANAFLSISVTLEYGIYCVAPIFYSILMANLWKHLDKLKADMKLLIKNMNRNKRLVAYFRSNPISDHLLEKHDRTIYNDFCEIIKYQQFLRGYCNEIIDIMYGYVLIFLIEFVGTLTFLLFTIIMEAGKERIIIIKMLILSISGMSGFIMHCFYAQLITDLNEIILNELANIPWYEQSIKFRKIYVMCLTQNQTSLRVTAAGMYILNYEFFMNCLKTVYSILNMMLLHYRHRGS